MSTETLPTLTDSQRERIASERGLSDYWRPMQIENYDTPSQFVTHGNHDPINDYNVTRYSRARIADILNSAYNEHAEREALSTSPQERTAQARALATMRSRESAALAQVDQLREQLNRLSEQVERLRSDQVRADDPRLSEFWEAAHQAADRAGHCQVFDQLCEELGGPRRATPGTAVVSVTFDVSVSVSDIHDIDDLDDDEITEAIVNLSRHEIDLDGWHVSYTDAD